MVRAHLWFDESLANAIAEAGVFHVLLVRDPRAIVVSEAHYLAEMAPWNHLHRLFRDLSHEERMWTSIEGSSREPQLFPDIGERLRRYVGWVGRADCLVRFEDLVLDSSDDVIDQLTTQWASDHRPGNACHMRDASKAVRRSHTFRVGSVDGWRSELDSAMIERITTLARTEIERLGYAI
jgi:hypothetical protein